jgi:hypothetical protein
MAKPTMMMNVMILVVAVTSAARAETTTWLCSVASAVSVDEDGTVGPPELGDRERPAFFRVDAATKELTLVAPQSRRGEVTKLDTVCEIDGSWVFSGTENGRGVNLIINPEGRMTLSVVGDGVVWSVFGHALPEGLGRPGHDTKAGIAGADDHTSEATLKNDEANNDGANALEEVAEHAVEQVGDEVPAEGVARSEAKTD